MDIDEPECEEFDGRPLRAPPMMAEQHHLGRAIDADQARLEVYPRQGSFDVGSGSLRVGSNIHQQMLRALLPQLVLCCGVAVLALPARRLLMIER